MTQSRKTSLAAFGVVVVVAVYLFLNSSYFTAAGLTWTGLNFLDEALLNEHVCFQPCNVLQIDRRALERQIEQHPWVENATVRWQWPNTIEVEVAERFPVASVAGPDGPLLIDRAGVLLTPPVKWHGSELPRIVNVDLTSTDQLKSAARIVSEMPPAITAHLDKWDAADRALITEEGTRILLGELEDLQSKFALLELIWNDLAANGKVPAVIDLRVLKNPVVRTH
ncbi:MAG: FtsQ-type POTRA domain-containing protein [Firmicutes bacterium]|nr:FtsQ-type POTRA domain-containing protein [Bacillota bacterium]